MPRYASARVPIDPARPLLPERLKLRRTSLRVTRQALGARVGVSARTIQNYEEGGSRPSPGVLLNIAQALEVSEGWLRGQVDTLGIPTPTTSLVDLVSRIVALPREDRAALLRLLQSEAQATG